MVHVLAGCVVTRVMARAADGGAGGCSEEGRDGDCGMVVMVMATVMWYSR